MKERLIKNLMVPVSEYVTVSIDDTLAGAVAALKKVQAGSDRKYPHRAVMIHDENLHVIGKVDFIDILRALEPKYDQMLSNKCSYHLGFSRQFQKNILESFRLWEKPLEHICRKAASRKVKTFMRTLTEGEFIEQNATLDEAIHQMVLGNYQSLLVLDDKKVVGILKLTDVFELISDEISACQI